MKELYAAIDHVLGASQATRTDRIVLAGLAIHMNVETFETRPGHARLMRFAGASKSTVQRSLRRLEDGLEEITLVAPGTGDQAAVYRVLAGAAGWSPMRDHVTPVSLGQGGCQNGGVTGSPKVTTQQERKNNSSFNGSSSGAAKLVPIAPDVFESIQARLAAEIGNGFIAHTMVAPLEQLGRRGNVLEVLAPDYCELELARRYGTRMSAIAGEVIGEPVEVKVVCEHELQGGRR